MPNFLTTLLMLIILAVPAWSQEQEAAGETADAAAPEAEESTTDVEEDSEDEVDDSDLDEQTYEGDDDDFVPTEEIPADEPIPFPSNI